MTDVNISYGSGTNNRSINSNPSTGIPGEPEHASVNVSVNQLKEYSTTKFIDDSETVQRDESQIDHMDPTFLFASDSQNTEQTLKDFLAKPIIFQQDTFKTTDAFTFLASRSMPLYLFTLPTGQLWLDKLKGYFGIRADIRFRIVVNANRFQQGRYIIGWVPLGGATSTTSNLKAVNFVNMHCSTLVQRTTIPHVEIDLATQTSAELLVPFASVYNFWPLTSAISGNDTSSLGYINLYPYSPLVSPTGSTTASYTIFASLENVQLFGASSPQSSLFNREVSNKANGPISKPLMNISKGFQEFAKVPLLSQYALGASWIADRISKVASIFGFSKPTQGDSLQKVVLYNNPAHCNVDGDNDAKTLSFLSKPATIPIKGLAPTAYDEMDFSYVARKYAYFSNKNWSLSDPVGNLISLSVKPGYFVTTTASVTHHTPISYVASFFRYYRGSIKFRFKLVKTEFHSGRLQVSFYPTDESIFTANPYFVNRQIIDIRETNEFEVIIPYIARFPWFDAGAGFGTLNIDILDPLIAPASVSSSITVLQEVAAGDDFEVAIPKGVNAIMKIVAPQSSNFEEKSSNQLSFNIGNSSIVANPINAAAFCMGDKISSFRSLLRRFSYVGPNNKTSTSTTRLNTVGIKVLPDCINMSDASTPTELYTADLLSIIAPCYMFMSGGIRIKDVYSPSLSATTIPATVYEPSINLSVNGFSNTIDASKMFSSVAAPLQKSMNEHEVFNFAKNNNSLTVEIPQYTSSLCRNIHDIIVFQGSAPPTYANYISYRTCTLVCPVFYGSKLIGDAPITATYDGYELHNFYRAMADDGNLSYFISIPPMVGTNPSVPSGFY